MQIKEKISQADAVIIGAAAPHGRGNSSAGFCKNNEYKLFDVSYDGPRAGSGGFERTL